MSGVTRHWVDNVERRLSLLRTPASDDWIDVALEHVIVQTWETADLLLVCFDVVDGEEAPVVGAIDYAGVWRWRRTVAEVRATGLPITKDAWPHMAHVRETHFLSTGNMHSVLSEDGTIGSAVAR